MGWKLLLVAGVFSATLWWFGYGPAELRRAALTASSNNAAAVSPDGGDEGADWGSAG